MPSGYEDQASLFLASPILIEKNENVHVSWADSLEELRDRETMVLDLRKCRFGVTSVDYLGAYPRAQAHAKWRQ